MPSPPVSRATAFALACALLAGLVLVGQRLSQSGTATAGDAVAPLEAVVTPPSRPPLVVYVVGAVRRPGLYRLRDGARVADAVARAGGAARRADLAALNLAAPLVDGLQVVVPRRMERQASSGPPAVGRASGSGPAMPGTAAAARVSLSAASAEELDALPGIGPVTAQHIVDYRTEHGPFRSVDDLDAVPGIGPARIEQLRDLVTP
ncbi:MAG TPA: ComEA family DNA-binding protein [Gaiellaceae bacterium]|nr:ComEA family DNA-binding protein [Gaiellaceae bacterium]